VIRKQGFVALLDVLGFSERVSGEGTSGLDTYIDTVVSLAQLYFGVDTVLFSDTVVLYAFDDSPGMYEEIVELTSALSYHLLMAEVPTRGAIAYGAFARSERESHGVVVAGRPIIEAHFFESQLQWIGAMLSPSVLRQVPELASCGPLSGPRGGEDHEEYFARVAREARVQRCQRIPVQGRGLAEPSFLEGFGVVPLPRPLETPDKVRDGISEALAKLRWLKQLAPEPRSQSKYQHSISWLEGLYSDWISSLR
jgi:hypothetical protein